MGRIYFGKAPLAKTQGAIKEEKDKEEKVRNNLWANIDLSIYDVVRMTDDEFTRLSAIPNFGNIIVQGKMGSMNLATAIKYYNLDLYAKYKLLLDDYVEAINDEENEEDYDEINDGYGYSAYLKNKQKIIHRVSYKPSFLETYENDVEE